MIFIRVSLLLLISNLVAAQDTDSENLPGEYRTPEAQAGEFQRPLTDEEVVIAKDYEHSGYIQRQLEEECKKNPDNEAACNGDSAAVFGENGDMIVKIVSQMYSMFGLGAGKIGFNEEGLDESIASATGDKKKELEEIKKDGGQEDYCKYIPIGTTLVAQTYQATAQNAISADVEDNSAVAQKEYLYKQARTHKERAKSASIEFYGWGSTAACYTALTASTMGLGNASGGTWLKIGASTFLAAFYKKQQSNHKKYESIVKGIADDLPGKGECNPITMNDCYCAQPETEMDAQYCLPQLAVNQENVPEGYIAVSCVGANGQSDLTCECNKTNSCLDRTFAPLFSNFGNLAGTASLLGPARELVNGRFNAGSLDGTAGRSLAIAKKALAKADSKIPVKGLKLNAEQKRAMNVLRKAGIPPRIAARLATTPVTAAGKRYADRIASISPDIDSSDFKSPGRDVFATKKSSKRKSRSNPFARSSNRGSSGNTLKYAQAADKATRQAAITRDTGKNIFEIINYRYQNTGWDKLEFIME